MKIKIDASSSYAGIGFWYMEDTIIKQEDQTIWYENDELIKEYLESSKNLSKTKAVSPKEKLSLLKLIKKSITDPTE